MIYIILDTNIILDMIFARQNELNKRLVEDFTKLLNRDDIRLLIPDIIMDETMRNIDSCLDEIKNKIRKSANEIKDVHGFNTANDTAFLQKLKYAIEAVNMFADFFDDNRNLFSQESITLANSLFQMKNAIILHSSDGVRVAALKRCIEKRAPAHKSKNSSADSLIIEFILHLDKFVDTLSGDDIIYFVSRNIEDFSTENKEEKNRIFHADIIEDISKSKIPCEVYYYTNFPEFIKKGLKPEIDRIDELNQISPDEYMQLIYDDYAETLREAAGLTPYSEFGEMVKRRFREDSFSERVMVLVAKKIVSDNLPETLELGMRIDISSINGEKPTFIAIDDLPEDSIYDCELEIKIVEFNTVLARGWIVVNSGEYYIDMEKGSVEGGGEDVSVYGKEILDWLESHI